MIDQEFFDTLHIKEGEQRRIDCPTCGGVKTLSVKCELGTYKYNCFRGICDEYGKHSYSPDYSSLISSMDKSSTKRSNIKSTEELLNRFVPANTAVLSWFRKYPVASTQEVDLRYDPRENRAVFCYGNSDVGFAAIGRTLDKKTTPKWKKYGNSLLPFSYGCGRTVVLVEDVPSAIAVGSLEKFSGMALTGTSFGSGMLKHIMQYDAVLVALDKDATVKGLSSIEPLISWVKPVRSILLDKDLKVYNKEDLCRILS